MKPILALLALALMLAGCTAPDGSDENAADSSNGQVGGQVSGEVVAVDPEGNSSTNTTGNSTNATG